MGLSGICGRPKSRGRGGAFSALTLAVYRRDWREKLRWVAKGYEYPDSVAAALGLSLEAVVAKSRTAYDLLCLFAWLAPDRIPRKELLEPGAAKLPEALAGAFADHEEWLEVIGTLAQYSLLGRDRAGGVVTGYSVHRVVQQVVRDRLAPEGASGQWLTAACDLVDSAFPPEPQEPRSWLGSGRCSAASRPERFPGTRPWDRFARVPGPDVE